MKKVIFSLILIFLSMSISGSVLASAQEDYSYSVGLNYHYQNKTLNLEWLNLVKGSISSHFIQPKDGYLAKIISFEGKIIYYFRFDIPTISMASPLPEWFDPETGEQIYFPKENLPPDITFSFVIPYFPEGKTIEFYNSEDNLLLSVDLSEYQLCQQDMENCEDILIQYHQQEIEWLKGVPGSGEEIQIRQSRIENLQHTKSIKERIKGVSMEMELIESEEGKGIWWQIIFIVLGVLIFSFIIYFVGKRYFLKKS